MAGSIREMRDGDVGSVVVVENGKAARLTTDAALAGIASERGSS